MYEVDQPVPILRPQAVSEPAQKILGNEPAVAAKRVQIGLMRGSGDEIPETIGIEQKPSRNRARFRAITRGCRIPKHKTAYFQIREHSAEQTRGQIHRKARGTGIDVVAQDTPKTGHDPP
ncbi:MAG: hypothetical protein QUS35_10945 [bacterium]|nr:hypothetical protein [bacterium]